mmetsp:Transcript_68876/g.165331  ORF Transcript_68876/g.165331 Transcript_68876/m.165331 type:complete len:553 (-) Transcript_68876:183-1841(-)
MAHSQSAGCCHSSRECSRRPGRRSPPLIRGVVAAALVLVSVSLWESESAFASGSGRWLSSQRQPLRCAVQTRAVAEAPGKYRAITRIRLREAPDIKATPTGKTVEPGEEFEAIEVVKGDGDSDLAYLKVDGRGWVFDQGIAGDWVGKPIVEAMPTPVGSTPAPAPAQAEEEKAAPAPAPEAASSPAPAVETVLALGVVPLRSLRMPMGALGAGIDFIQLEIDGKPTPMNFVLASGFPVNAVTPKGQELLGGGPPDAQFKGGWLSAAAAPSSKVDLKNIELVESGAILDDIFGCEVMDTMQAQLAEQMGLEVHGMLGKPFFEKYDVDIDRYAGRVELYPPGQASSLGFYSSVKHMPSLELPAGMVGIGVKGSVSMQGTDLDQTSDTFIGVIDTGNPYSIINWEAAKLLGFTGEKDTRLQGATKMLGAGRDGRPIEMPVIRVKFTLSGVPMGVKPMILGLTKEEFESSGGKGWYLETESLGKNAPEGIAFGAVNVAVGDTLPFASMDDSKVGPFKGAAAILGQDLFYQTRRTVLNMNDKNCWMEAGDIRDMAEM